MEMSREQDNLYCNSRAGLEPATIVGSVNIAATCTAPAPVAWRGRTERIIISVYKTIPDMHISSANL